MFYFKNIKFKLISIIQLADYDWWRALRFSLYGGLFVAPTLYSWIKVSSAMWPRTSLQTAVFKTAVEQISYTPAAMTCFYFLMSLLEMKTVGEAAAEVRKKFIPTYKVSKMITSITKLFTCAFKGGYVNLARCWHNKFLRRTREESSAFHQCL